MRKSNKKGFTIVELVIVIAVIAILAAVLIPTFAGLIAKANLSNDQQAIRNMNTSLATQVVPKTKFDRAGDAINALYMDGWNLGKMKTYSNGFHYAYNLDDNKMYLVNEKSEVIYPEAVDKSKLYGLYDGSASAKIDGVTKYVAMSNIIGADDFEQLVGDTAQYTIDLNGFFFGIQGDVEYNNVTLVNGILLAGSATTATTDGVTTYEMQEMNSTAEYGTYENKVFYNVSTSETPKAGTTYKNCIFYNCAIRPDGDAGKDSEITFENCSFIGALDGNAPIDVYQYSDYALTVIFKNCTFTQTVRGVAIANTHSVGGVTVKIDGCTFNGTTGEKFAALQIARPDAIVEFTNNTVNSLGKAPAVVRYHKTFFSGDNNLRPGKVDDLAHFTFSGNKVSSDIPEEKYVDLDTTNNEEFYNAALQKFKDGLK